MLLNMNIYLYIEKLIGRQMKDSQIDSQISLITNISDTEQEYIGIYRKINRQTIEKLYRYSQENSQKRLYLRIINTKQEYIYMYVGR